jgi:hypothetical protein
MKVGLFTNIRDEKHIREWVIHHLLLGVNYIIIFDHKSKTLIKYDLEKIDKRIRVINASNIHTNVKIRLMNVATIIAKKNRLDWMIYLDADEFIILNPPYNYIPQLLHAYGSKAHSLAINWVMFGSNFLKTDPDGLILENYTRCDATLNAHVKSFVRPKETINAANPHYYNIKNKNKYYTLNRTVLRNNYSFNNCDLQYGAVPAYIAHYVNQSEETYIKRRSLPRDDTGTIRELVPFNELHKEYNNSINLYPSERYSATIKRILSEFQVTF